MTPRTLTDPADLLAELDAINAQGYSLDREEFLEGMVAIAVPVTDPQGRYVASLAYHGPDQRLALEEAIARKEILQSAALKLSQLMFS